MSGKVLVEVGRKNSLETFEGQKSDAPIVPPSLSKPATDTALVPPKYAAVPVIPKGKIENAAATASVNF